MLPFNILLNFRFFPFPETKEEKYDDKGYELMFYVKNKKFHFLKYPFSDIDISGKAETIYETILVFFIVTQTFFFFPLYDTMISRSR